MQTIVQSTRAPALTAHCHNYSENGHTIGHNGKLGRCARDAANIGV